MNRIIAAALLALFITGVANGQQKAKSKSSQDVTIKKSGSSDEKMTIVIDGDKVTVNGKPITEYHGDDIIIRKKALEEELAPLAKTSPRVRIVTTPKGYGSSDFDFEFNMDKNFQYDLQRQVDREMRQLKQVEKQLALQEKQWAQHEKEWSKYEKEWGEQVYRATAKPQAMLGVVTEKDTKGLKLVEISSGSAAEKAGLKKGDIITRFAGVSVNDPEKLRELVTARKPEEEVEITYLKAGEKKERKLKLKLGSQNTERIVYGYPRSPRPPQPPRAPNPPKPPHDGDFFIATPDAPIYYRQGENYSFNYNSRPQLGVRIQDTDDSTGVKVLDVHDGSLAATAGIKESDVIVNIDGKRVKDTDDAREALQGVKDKYTYPIVLNRGGQVVNLEIKIPKKLKKADL